MATLGSFCTTLLFDAQNESGGAALPGIGGAQEIGSYLYFYTEHSRAAWHGMIWILFFGWFFGFTGDGSVRVRWEGGHKTKRRREHGYLYRPFPSCLWTSKRGQEETREMSVFGQKEGLVWLFNLGYLGWAVASTAHKGDAATTTMMEPNRIEAS